MCAVANGKPAHDPHCLGSRACPVTLHTASARGHALSRARLTLLMRHEDDIAVHGMLSAPTAHPTETVFGPVTGAERAQKSFGSEGSEGRPPFACAFAFAIARRLTSAASFAALARRWPSCAEHAFDTMLPDLPEP